MTLKEYCQIHGGSDMLEILSQHLNPTLLRKVELRASEKHTNTDVDKQFESMAYDLIYNFLKFCSKTRVDAHDVKTL